MENDDFTGQDESTLHYMISRVVKYEQEHPQHRGKLSDYFFGVNGERSTKMKQTIKKVNIYSASTYEALTPNDAIDHMFKRTQENTDPTPDEIIQRFSIGSSLSIFLQSSTPGFRTNNVRIVRVRRKKLEEFK